MKQTKTNKYLSKRSRLQQIGESRIKRKKKNSFRLCFLIRMAVTLWSIQTPGTAQLERDINVMNNKKKVIKMLMVVVALFTLAWLPLQLYDVLNQMVPQINMSI